MTANLELRHAYGDAEKQRHNNTRSLVLALVTESIPITHEVASHASAALAIEPPAMQAAAWELVDTDRIGYDAMGFKPHAGAYPETVHEYTVRTELVAPLARISMAAALKRYELFEQALPRLTQS